MFRLRGASLGSIDLPAHNKLTLTSDGESHPIMRIGGSADETRKLWSAMPALAASATVGGPRPGATILALTTAPGGGVLMCYGVSNATKLRIEPDVEPVKPAITHCLEIFPKKTTTYTLTAEDDRGNSKTASLTVRIR